MSLPAAVMPSRPGEQSTAVEILEWALEEYGDRFAVCTSFQASGMVILDLAAKIAGSALRVFTIDTGRMPPETYELMTEVRERYGITIEAVYPDSRELERMVSAHGPNLFYDAVSKRRLCCELRKVRPLKRKLAGLDAWAVGLRRSQNETREQVLKVDTDLENGGIVKLSPLADWTDDEVWEFSRKNNVPQHALYAQGYTSIGCAPCTRSTSDGEHERAGRWWWEEDGSKECGIHFTPEGNVKRALDVLLSEVLGTGR